MARSRVRLTDVFATMIASMRTGMRLARDGDMEGRIDVQNPRELQYWCDKLRASEDEVRRAVDQGGPDAEKVREHLFGGFTSGPSS